MNMTSSQEQNQSEGSHNGKDKNMAAKGMNQAGSSSTQSSSGGGSFGSQSAVSAGTLGTLSSSSPGMTGMQSQGSNQAQQHAEGPVAKAIEQQTAKLPSDLFLWAAVGSIGASAVCELAGMRDKSRFFGQWVAPFLLFGVYNKLVKLQGSDGKGAH